MANRSTFLGHLPRQIKKEIRMALANGTITDVHQAADIRKLYVSAHKAHKAFKLNKRVDPAIKAALKADKIEAEAQE